MNNIFFIYVKNLLSSMKREVLLSLILMITVGFTEGIGLLLLIPLLQLVGLSTVSGNIGQLAQFISSIFSTLRIPITLITILAVYIFITSISALLNKVQTISNSNLENKFTLHLREKLYKAIAQTNWLFFSSNRSSDFTHLLISELARVGAGTHFFLQLIATSIIVFIYLLLALKISAHITLTILTCALVLLFLLKEWNNKVYLTGEQISKEASAFYAASIEHFSAMKTIKSYCAEERNLAIFTKLAFRLAQISTNAVRILTNIKLGFDIGSVLILSLVLYISFKILNINTASVFLLLYLFAKAIPRFSNIQQDYHQVINMLPAFNNIIDMEAKCISSKEIKTENKDTIKFNKLIELNNVSFSYKEGKTLFRNLNLTIKKGETISIVGPSGSGKSTIADLIMGLLTPDKGQLLIDNNPLSAEKINSWRGQIGYVTQDTFLFNDTIRANLLWACPHSSEKEINEVIKLAACEEFISTLPQGLETILGDRGIRLSGGERQRLALARAILRKPSLLILDEATSSLDSENEKYIQQTIEKFHGNITVLIISHRLSTICNSDKIYVLDSGNIIESGNWNNLIANKTSKFYKLFLAQQTVLTS